MVPFEDREIAGKLLAEMVRPFVDDNTVILGIPRGGVVVAYVVAEELELPLDIIILKKLGAPGNPELAIGAVTADGGVYIDERVAEMVGADNNYLKREIARKMREAQERERLYRGNRPQIDVKGKTIIIVDDGVATGSTLITAIQAERSHNPARIIAAFPVAPPESVHRIDKYADEVICLHMTEYFYAVGQFYINFQQTTHEEVVELLKKSESFGLHKQLKT
jgi:predicted phosphoribosyltransferase